MVIPAAPTPVINIFRSSIFLLTNFKALIKAATVTMAVPC